MNDYVPEVQCPVCGTTIRARLGDQVVIAELRAQGWLPPHEREGTEVQFNRIELIEAAKATIAAENDHRAREAEAANAKATRDGAEWVAKYGAAWLDTLPKLRRKLKAGQPLYTSDLPKRLEWRGVATFGDEPPREVTARVWSSPDLNNLIAVLSVIEDETVTPSGLRAVGVTSGALSAALRTLGRTKNEGN